MAREFEFSLIAEFKDKASRGIKSLAGRLEDLNDYARRGRRGLLGGLFGGFGRRGAISGPQGGLGGIVAGLGRLTAKAVAMPAKIVGAFARALPKIGGIASQAVNSVVNVIQGIAVTAANVAGRIVNLFTRAFSKIASVAGRVLGKGAMWGGLAAAGVTAFSVRQAGKVQDAWNRVRTIMKLGPQETRKWMGRLRDEAIRTGKSLTEVIKGFYQIGSAGIRDPREAYKTLRASIEASVGGWTQLPTIVKTVTRTMTAFGKGADKARETMDKLLQTVHTGQIELPEIAQYFASLGKMAAEANLSLDETLGMLGVIARSDEPNKIVTQLRAAFMKLNTQTGQTRKALQKLRDRGLAIGPEAIEEVGIIKWIDRLRKAKKQYPKLISDIFPERAFVGVTSMINMQDEIAKGIEDVGDAAGTTREDFLTMMDSVTKAAMQAWRVAKDLALSFGKPTARWLTSIRDRIAESGWSLDWFRKKAQEAGKKVRDAFKGVYQYLKDLADGRDLDWEGIKGALTEVKNDAVEKAVAAWTEIKNTLWPKIKTGFSNLLTDLWAMVGDELSRVVDDWVGKAFRQMSTAMSGAAFEQIMSTERGFGGLFWRFDQDNVDRMKELVMQAERLGRVTPKLKKEWKKLMDRMGVMELGPGGQAFGQWGWMRQAGPLGFLQQAAQIGPAGKPIARMLAEAGDITRSGAQGLRGAAAAGHRSAAAARRRQRTAALRGRLQQAIRDAIGDYPTTLEPGEMAQVTRVAKEYMQKKGASQKEIKKGVDTIKDFMRSVVEDLRFTQEEMQELKRTVRRLATARN